MDKFTKAIAAIMLIGAAVIAAGCTKLDDNSTPVGAIIGKFTINSDGDQVHFSKGNLQYQATTNTWRFAEHQWDVVGEDNSKISQSYNGWIDLFGWGTSGWDNGNVYYQPYDYQWIDESQGYGYGPTNGGGYFCNLTDIYSRSDWGVYNSISNGGKKAGQWRTLTEKEWEYVFNVRTTPSDIRYAKACVNNVNGVILVPDDWNINAFSLNDTNMSSAGFNSNEISELQWSELEDMGVVFLPAASSRFGTEVIVTNNSGHYWSATHFHHDLASLVSFSAYSLSHNSVAQRCRGLSVRLVHVAE